MKDKRGEGPIAGGGGAFSFWKCYKQDLIGLSGGEAPTRAELLSFIFDGSCSNIYSEVSDVKTKERYLADLDWAEEHHSELLKRYRDKWVAVYKGRVVASGKSGREVEQEAKQKTGEEAIAMYYVDSGSSIYEG